MKKTNWKHLLMVYGGGLLALAILHESGHIIVGGGLVDFMFFEPYSGIFFDGYTIIGVQVVNDTIYSGIAGFVFSLIVPIYMWLNKEVLASVVFFVIAIVVSISDFVWVWGMI